MSHALPDDRLHHRADLNGIVVRHQEAGIDLSVLRDGEQQVQRVVGIYGSRHGGRSELAVCAATDGLNLIAHVCTAQDVDATCFDDYVLQFLARGLVVKSIGDILLIGEVAA